MEKRDRGCKRGQKDKEKHMKEKRQRGAEERQTSRLYSGKVDLRIQQLNDSGLGLITFFFLLRVPGKSVCFIHPDQMWDFFYTCRLVAVKTSFTHKPSPDLKPEVRDFPDEHHRKQSFTMVNEQKHVRFTSEQQALPNQSVSQRVSALNTETNIQQHETKKTTTNS